MSKLRVFKSTIPSVNYILPNGKPLIFQQGVLYTDIPQEIQMLEYEIQQGHPHIYIDDAQKEIEAEDLNPMVALKKGVVAQMSREELVAALQAKEAEAINPANDRGESDQSVVKPANTIDIAPAAAGGSGTALTARLATLNVKK